MAFDIAELNERIKQESAFIDLVQGEFSKVIVGQKYMIDRLLIGLLCNGHILLEGVPGLAKTLTISTLARIIDGKFHRIQFTPDLLPADLTGTLIYNQKESNFFVKKGPVFANLILADEINRSPAKVQSALLEAMQEKQVTIGDETYKLEEPFLVLATQNPVEQEGTYPLPEAQVDRFMLKIIVGYPTKVEEMEIMRRMANTAEKKTINKIISPKQILQARQLINDIYMDEKIEQYIIDIIFATRDPQTVGLPHLKPLIQYGASPRASIFLNLAAKAHAFLKHRGYVTPEDVKAMAYDVLRHRVILTYEAEAEEKTTDFVIGELLAKIEVP
ncbi:MAG: MoxR family ATPase [Bacteroidetes bacterium]|nr:MoxR family ATPase [Bacteroidota bacterium]